MTHFTLKFYQLIFLIECVQTLNMYNFKIEGVNKKRDYES